MSWPSSFGTFCDEDANNRGLGSAQVKLLFEPTDELTTVSSINVIIDSLLIKE